MSSTFDMWEMYEAAKREIEEEKQQQNPPPQEEDRCPNCKMVSYIISDKVESYTVCSQCGFIIERMLLAEGINDNDFCVSQHVVSNHTDVSFYMDAPTTLGGYISSKYANRSDFALKYKLMVQMNSTSREKSLGSVFNQFDSIQATNNITENILRQAKTYWTKITEQNVMNRINSGRSTVSGSKRQGLIAACFDRAFKFCGTARTKEEICKYCDIDTKTFCKGDKVFRQFEQLLSFDHGDEKNVTNVKFMINEEEQSHMKHVIDNEDVSYRYVNALKLPFSYNKRISTLYFKYKKYFISFTINVIISGIITYLVFYEDKDKQLKLTKKHINAVTNVRYPSMKKVLDIIINFEQK